MTDVIDSTENIGITLGEVPPQPPIQAGLWMIAIPLGLGLIYQLLKGKRK